MFVYLVFFHWLKTEGGISLDASTLELYNLRLDPGETENLAGSNPALVTRLQNQGRELVDQIIPPRFMGLQTTEQVNRRENISTESAARSSFTLVVKFMHMLCTLTWENKLHVRIWLQSH